MSTFVAIVLGKRRLKTRSNSYPVKLRVTFERKSRYYLTNYALSEEAYNSLKSSRLKDELRTIKNALKDLERAAEKCACELTPFSYAEFEKFFRGKDIFVIF